MKRLSHRIIIILALFAVIMLSQIKHSEPIMRQVYSDNNTIIKYDRDGALEMKTSENYEEITFEGIDAYLRESRQITDYDKLDIYWMGNDVNFDFYLSSNAQRNQIASMRDFFVSFAIGATKEGFGYGGSIEWFYFENRERIDNRCFRIYIDDDLILKYRIKMNGFNVVETAYFENYIKHLSQRPAITNVQLVLKDEVSKICKVEDMVVEKALKPYAAIIRLRINEKKYSAYLSELEKAIEICIHENKGFLKSIECKEVLLIVENRNQIVLEEKVLIDNTDLTWHKDIWQ